METPFLIKIAHFYQIWKLTLSDPGGSVFIFSTVSTRIHRSELVTSARWKFKNFENFFGKIFDQKFRSKFLREFNTILSADFFSTWSWIQPQQKFFRKYLKKILPLKPKISRFFTGFPVFASSLECWLSQWFIPAVILWLTAVDFYHVVLTCYMSQVLISLSYLMLYWVIIKPSFVSSSAVRGKWRSKAVRRGPRKVESGKSVVFLLGNGSERVKPLAKGNVTLVSRILISQLLLHWFLNSRFFCRSLYQ